MKQWLDRRSTWQFVLITLAGSGLGIVVALLLIDTAAGLHATSIAFWLTYATGYSAVMTAMQTWRRRRRLDGLSSRQLTGMPGPMLPYVGLGTGPGPGADRQS